MLKWARRNAELVMACLHWIFDSVILPASRLPSQDLSGLQKCWIDNGLLALFLILWHYMHQGWFSEDQPGLQKCWTCNGLLASIFDSVISLCIKAAFLRSVRAAESWIGYGLLALNLGRYYLSASRLPSLAARASEMLNWNAELVMACLHWIWFCGIVYTKADFWRSARAAQMLKW